jgi:hypothetical protein
VFNNENEMKFKWDYKRVPCSNCVFVKKTSPTTREYVCLGHGLTYHGDAKRSHKFWIGEQNVTPLDNYLKWDFCDPASLVCSHHSHEGGMEYRCLGHSKGDLLVPTFHGDPSRSHKFWVFPLQHPLKNPEYDFRSPLICNNFKLD